MVTLAVVSILDDRLSILRLCGKKNDHLDQNLRGIWLKNKKITLKLQMVEDIWMFKDYHLKTGLCRPSVFLTKQP